MRTPHVFKEGCNSLCRACSHRGLTREQSLAQKQGFINKTLYTWAGAINPIASVEEKKCWGYRTSTTLATEWDGQKWLFGTKSLNEVIPINHCPVHHPLINSIVEVLSPNLPSSHSFPLAFLVISKKQCTLIVKKKSSDNHQWLTDNLKNSLLSLGLEGLWVHYNPSAGRRLFEKGGWVHLLGSKYSIDSNGLAYGPTSFQQQIQELYLDSLRKVESFLMPDLQSAVVDLYCGTGTSLSKWKEKNAQAIGVESNGEALECAAINAPRTTLLRGTCRLRIPQLSQWILQQLFISKRMLLYANPPRTGIEPEVLQWIVKIAKPERIAYLSCSPGTLNKNLQYLTQFRYEVNGLYPYDFFPQTHHIECLALLERI